ncbi:hypothetical protein ZWY2020_031709 [Hordeum vulgare]|nr:hypothetical protein ZWY2020_031709 [Hordeum vulgare]
MCFEFASCFGGRRRDDYGRSRGDHAHGYWLEPAPVCRQPPVVAVHDGPRNAGWQDKAGGETPWHSKVGDDAGYHGAHTTPRVHDAAADPREQHAAVDYHPYQHPTTPTSTRTPTTTLARYEVVSR